MASTSRPIRSCWPDRRRIRSRTTSAARGSDHGVGFAVAAAAGSVAGAIGQTAFVVTYARCPGRWRWPGALVAGSIAFAAVATGLELVGAPLVVLLTALFVALALALWLMPSDLEAAPAAPPQRWHLPGCMVISMVLVVVLTGAAPVLGPGLSGVLASYPVYAGILTIFAHHVNGPRAGIQVLRGLLLGLFAFGGFFAVLATLIERRGMALAFLAAIAVALSIQGCSLAVMLAVRRRVRSGVRPARVTPKPRPPIGAVEHGLPAREYNGALPLARVEQRER